nr:xylulose kinase-1 [Tanacetum cinerariifolium]
MKMEHYLCHTDYPIWQVIQNGNDLVSVTTDKNGMIKVLPPKTAEEVVAKERERKARTTLLMALPEDHLEKFHKMADAKEMWEAIKSRFGGNDESKKMKKYLLKQQLEGFLGVTFRVDRIEDREAMHRVQVQLVMEELRTELGMLIQVKQGRLSATTAMENRVALDEEQLLFIAGGQDNVVDEDMDKQPVQDLELNMDNDAVCEHHEAHEMHDDVQPNYIVDSHANFTSDSNMIPYDQYVKDNAPAKHVSVTTQNNVVDKSLTVELATYKDQVKLYERRARFELTEREQKIDEQLRIVITGRNIKEESLKKELHSVKMQLASTINHNKSMVEEVTSLKRDFKHKENKYLEEFLDMKALKEKKKVAIGYKSPLCLVRAKQVQSALYNGHEIIKTDHVPAIVYNSEDTLEIAEITRKKMN